MGWFRSRSGIGSQESQPQPAYSGPNQQAVSAFINSLPSLTKSDWYRVVAVAQQNHATDAFTPVNAAGEQAGRQLPMNMAAMLAEQHLFRAAPVWEDSMLAAQARAEVAAEAEARGATLGDLFAAGGGNEMRLAGTALSVAVCALVVSDLAPRSAVELALAPFRATSATLPAA